MTAAQIEAAEEMAAGWRSAAGPGHPAGALYASGDFAEADIVSIEASYTVGCSACTFSGHVNCC
jgi:hypothetical protein